VAIACGISGDPCFVVESSPADSVKTLGGEIPTLNGSVSLCSHLRWIFSIKMAYRNILILFTSDSYAKTASDTGLASLAGRSIFDNIEI
jgi:hypothetical protein